MEHTWFFKFFSLITLDLVPSSSAAEEKQGKAEGEPQISGSGTDGGAVAKKRKLDEETGGGSKKHKDIPEEEEE